MSKWTHAICQICWYEKNPGREPVTVLNGTEQICCFCGLKSKSGIYVREDPKGLRCEGEHPE